MRRMQHGSAIIAALLVVALVATVGTRMMWEQHFWVRQVANDRDRAQAHQLAQTSIDWARAVLAYDRRAGVVDHEGESWAARLPVFTTDGSTVEGHIEDEQGKFNLNNLAPGGQVNNAALALFMRLLTQLGLPPDLAYPLADWQDSDAQVLHAGSAEAVYYLAQEPPYRTADGPLGDVAELLLVRGYDAGVIARLRPFVTVLPEGTSINVNTAPAEVLAAAVEGLGIFEARRLVQVRKNMPFGTPEEFKGQLPKSLASSDVGNIAVGSRYFTVRGSVIQGNVRLALVALLDRSDVGFPKTIWLRLN